MHFVYIIRSLDTGRYYIGSSEDWQKRLGKHNGGKVRSTKAYAPWELVHLETMPDRTVARKRELQIKSFKGGNAFEGLVAK